MTQKHVLTGSSDRKGFTILCFSQEVWKSDKSRSATDGNGDVAGLSEISSTS